MSAIDGWECEKHGNTGHGSGCPACAKERVSRYLELVGNDSAVPSDELESIRAESYSDRALELRLKLDIVTADRNNIRRRAMAWKRLAKLRRTHAGLLANALNYSEARRAELESERDLYRAALRCERCKGTTIAWDEWRQILCPNCHEAREKARMP